MLPNVSHEMGNKPDRRIDYPEPIKIWYQNQSISSNHLYLLMEGDVSNLIKQYDNSEGKLRAKMWRPSIDRRYESHFRESIMI